MLKHKNIDTICVLVFVVTLLITGLFCFGENLGIERADAEPEYVNRIFDDSYVHRIELKIKNWDEFLENATKEE